MSYWWILWVLPMVSPCWGGLSASALGLRGFAVVWLSLPLSSVPPGWRMCVRGLGRAVRPFPIGSWVWFPAFPVVLVFLSGGGFCLFLPQPALSMHWSVSGVVNRLAVPVAGGRGPCPGHVRLVAYVHSWVGGLFCWGQARAPLAASCASWFPGVMGEGGWGVGGALIWDVQSPPPPVASA